MTLYIKIRGRIHGPMEESQIMQMIQQGKAGKFNEVSSDGQTWQRAADFPELFPQKVQVQRAGSGEGEMYLVDENGPQRSTGGGAPVWFLSNDGVTGLGPYSVEDILSLLASGKANRDSLVWIEGESPRQMKDVPEFNRREKSNSPIESPVEPASGPTCSKCEKPITEGIAFCPHCGAPQASAHTKSPLLTQVRCKKCGFVQEQGTTFCPVCGAGQAEMEGRGKSRIVYILLAIVILGCFGAHNFYANRKKQATMQLFLGITIAGTVITAIWAIIDALTVTTDGNDIPFKE